MPDPDRDDVRVWRQRLSAAGEEQDLDATYLAIVLLDYINEIRRDPLTPSLTADELMRRKRAMAMRLSG